MLLSLHGLSRIFSQNIPRFNSLAPHSGTLQHEATGDSSAGQVRYHRDRVAAAPAVLADDPADACVPPLVTVLVTILVMVLLPLVLVVVLVATGSVVPLDPLGDVCAGWLPWRAG